MPHRPIREKHRDEKLQDPESMMAQLALILWVPVALCRDSAGHGNNARSVGRLDVSAVLDGVRLSRGLRTRQGADPVLAAFLRCLATRQRILRRPPIGLLLAGALLAGGSFLTALTNSEPVTPG